jgi:hypothetical protein
LCFANHQEVTLCRQTEKNNLNRQLTFARCQWCNATPIVLPCR